jgi:predicted HAD superfamily Cof-like phosphohydrolase
LKTTWEEVISRFKEMGLDPDKVYESVCVLNDMAKIINDEEKEKAPLE